MTGLHVVDQNCKLTFICISCLVSFWHIHWHTGNIITFENVLKTKWVEINENHGFYEQWIFPKLNVIAVKSLYSIVKQWIGFVNLIINN